MARARVSRSLSLPAALAALLALAGCGATNVLVVEPAAEPLPAGRVAVHDVRVVARRALTGDWESAARDDAAALTRELRGELADDAGDVALILDVRLVAYEAEFNEPRLWGGGGSMARARIVVEAQVLDATERRRARIEVTGESVERGWSGASFAAARCRVVDAIAAFVRDQRER